MTGDIALHLVDEFRLLPQQREALRVLLGECFPRAEFYSKQLPTRRLLATTSRDTVGHIGLEHRVVGTSTGPATIFGLIDVCVAPSARRRGTASMMLAYVEALAAEHSIEFLVLFARDPRLYERNGYRRATNPLRWVKIHEHQIIGIGKELLEELMVKAVGARAWPEGLVDLLGYQF